MSDTRHPDLSVRKQLELDAPIETVWRAITDPAQVARWFSDEVRSGEFSPGTAGEFFWTDHGGFAFEVEEAEAPHRLVWSWAREPQTGLHEGPHTRVEWRLESLPAGRTLLSLVETGFADDEARRDNDGGWDSELGELRDLFGA